MVPEEILTPNPEHEKEYHRLKYNPIEYFYDDHSMKISGSQDSPKNEAPHDGLVDEAAT